MAIIVGFAVFFTIVLLTLIFGAVANKDDQKLRRHTQEDIAAGRDRDVTVTPRANDPWVRSEDDRLPQA